MGNRQLNVTEVSRSESRGDYRKVVGELEQILWTQFRRTVVKMSEQRLTLMNL